MICSIGLAKTRVILIRTRYKTLYFTKKILTKSWVYVILNAVMPKEWHRALMSTIRDPLIFDRGYHPLDKNDNLFATVSYISSAG